MIVTKIERQKRHPDRVNIYLDGVFAFGLDEEVCLRYGLRKGDPLDAKTHGELLGAEESSRARLCALRYLSYRLRSEREIRAKLAEKKFPDGVVDRVVAQLLEARMLDDRRFAAAFVHDARLRKPTGERLLRQQLLAKGVARSIVDAAVSEHSSRREEEESALGAARSLLQRYRTSSKRTDADAERRRVTQFLLRRGFGWDIVQPVLRIVFQSSEELSDESDDGINRI